MEAFNQNKMKDTQTKLERICVFCGSSYGNENIYTEAAIEIGKQMVAKNINLVYGGGNIDLMGAIAQTVYNGGCHVLGVIPKALACEEITGETIGERKIVSDMHKRKAEMSKNSDAFIALPGGYGTLEELFEIVTWAQLGIHQKPVGLLNVDGFFNDLLTFIDKAVAKGFITPSARQIILTASTSKELISKLEDYNSAPGITASKLNWNNEQ